MGKFFCLGILLVVCSHSVYGQWGTAGFIKVEELLYKIQANVKGLFDTVTTKKTELHGVGAPSASLPQSGGLQVAYGSFFEDVERRLLDIENATGELGLQLRDCPSKRDAPTKPGRVNVSSTTLDGVSSIQINWEPLKEYGENLQYKLYFKPLGAGSKEVVFRICDANQTSAYITDLAPRSQYTIRLATVDGDVIESSSSTITKMTPDIIPSSPVNIKGMAINANEVRLEWDEPMIRGHIDEYSVYHHDSFTGQNKTIRIRPAVRFVKIGDLTEGTIHHFAVVAASDNGESEPSAPFLISTPPFIPEEVRRVRAKAYNTTAILVKFSPPKYNNGLIRGFRVNYTDFRVPREEGYVDTDDPNARSVLITNLRPNKDYYFSVTAFTRKSSSYPSSYVITKSKAAVPTEVRNLRCRVLRYDPPMIQLRWEPPMHLYSYDRPIYRIMWGVKNGVLRNETISNMTMQWDSDYLDDALLHVFIVAAENEKGIGNEVEVQLKTPERKFATPRNIKVGRMRQKNTTLLAVSWDRMNRKINVAGFRVLHRVFQWVYQGRWVITEVPDPTATSTTIPIKDPTLSYIVVVRAKLKRRRNNRPRRGKTMRCKIKYRRDKNAGGTQSGPGEISMINPDKGQPIDQGIQGYQRRDKNRGRGGNQGMEGMGRDLDMRGNPDMGRNQGMDRNPGMERYQGMGGMEGMGRNPEMGGNERMGRNRQMGVNQGGGRMGGNERMGRNQEMGINQGRGGMGVNPEMGGNQWMDTNQGMGNQGMSGEPGMGNQGMGGEPVMGNQGMGGEPVMGNQGMGGEPGMGNQGMGGEPGMGSQGMGGEPGMGNQGMGGEPGMGNQGMSGGPGMGNQGIGGNPGAQGNQGMGEFMRQNQGMGEFMERNQMGRNQGMEQFLGPNQGMGGMQNNNQMGGPDMMPNNPMNNQGMPIDNSPGDMGRNFQGMPNNQMAGPRGGNPNEPGMQNNMGGPRSFPLENPFTNPTIGRRRMRGNQSGPRRGNPRRFQGNPNI